MDQLESVIQNIVNKQLDQFKSEVFQEISLLRNELNEVKAKFEFYNEKKSEQYYQKKLEKLLDGTHTKTKHGIVDIITKDAIYELKSWNNYKQVVGQLKAYSLEKQSNKRLCAVFFGECKEQKKSDIIDFLVLENIEVYEVYEDDEAIIRLRSLHHKNSTTITNTVSTFTNLFVSPCKDSSIS